MNVFELYAKLGLDTSEYTEGLENAKQATNGINGKAVAAAAGVAAVGVAAVKAGKAMYDFGADAVRTGMSFDVAMSQVAATMGMTTEELSDSTSEAYQSFQTLRAFAMEQGATTKFTSEQAAEALNYMALAGYDAQKSMAMMPHVLALAAAGNIELAQASDMVTDAQTAFGLNEEQTVAMVDQMAMAASKTNTSVAQMGAAFLTVGATARNLKGGTLEAAQVLGILADNSIKGSEAGTSLRNILQSLEKDKHGAIAALGVDVYDAEGKMRSLESIFLELGDAMADMTDQEKSGIISSIFDRYDLAAANALLGTSADRWGEVAGYLEDAEGSAEKMSETQMDNLKGDLDLFNSAFSNLQVMLSDKLTPGIRTIVQQGTEFINWLVEALGEGGSLNGVLKLIGTIIDGIASVVSTILDGIQSIAEWTSNAVTGSADDTVSWAKNKYVDQINAAGGIDAWVDNLGMEAGGISFVPRNATYGLHYGERVLTADENRKYTNAMNGNAETPIMITVQSVLDGRIIGETAFNYNARKQRMVGA